MIAKRFNAIAVFAGLCLCLSSHAQEDSPPSGDFLEYLASLVEEDGEWVDPLELDGVPGETIDGKSAHEDRLDETQRAEEKL